MMMNDERKKERRGKKRCHPACSSFSRFTLCLCVVFVLGSVSLAIYMCLNVSKCRKTENEKAESKRKRRVRQSERRGKRQKREEAGK
jgi:cell division protein FtsI/penicillin-binding protein 2